MTPLRRDVDAAVKALNNIVVTHIVPSAPDCERLPKWLVDAIVDVDWKINGIQDAIWWEYPPNENDALSFDEVEAAGLDGTLRNLW